MVPMKRKKTYSNVTGKEMRECVEDIENAMNTIDDDIFANPSLVDALNRLKRLDTSERRLFIVFSELDCSIIKTAKYFQVDRRTISNRIKEIRDKIDGIDTGDIERSVPDTDPSGGTPVQMD